MEQTSPGSVSDRGRLFHGRRAGPEPSAGEREGAPLARKEPSAGEREGAPLARKEPSAGEREGTRLARKDPGRRRRLRGTSMVDERASSVRRRTARSADQGAGCGTGGMGETEGFGRGRNTARAFGSDGFHGARRPLCQRVLRNTGRVGPFPAACVTGPGRGSGVAVPIRPRLPSPGRNP